VKKGLSLKFCQRRCMYFQNWRWIKIWIN